MSDPYNIEPLTRSTPYKPIKRKSPDQDGQNKNKKDKKKQEEIPSDELEDEKKSSLDDDESLPHVDEFV